MSAHAILSASGAHKWLHCPPSARLEETFADEGSDYAREGTLAHRIGELKLRKHFTPMGPKKYGDELKKLQADPLYNPEMLDHTETYLEFVQQVVHSFSSPPYLTIEKRLDYSYVVPGGFGTGDCIVIGGDTLVVIDFKYGKGVPVSAESNPQMMLYALGAIPTYALTYGVSRVRMAIVQPRLGDPSVWETSTDELMTWANQIKPIAELAFEGKGEFCAGEWCRFCRAKAQCRARSGNMTALEAFGGALPPLLTDAEVGDVLTRAQTLKAWVSDLEEYALSALLQGGEIPGWKAVEGRSNRAFSDTDAAFKKLVEAGYDESILYERKPITLTAVEDLLKKKAFAELLGPYVVKPPGKPTLATETDKREAITANPKPEDVFAQMAS